MKYRKKPVEIEAWDVTELNRCAEKNWQALPDTIAAAYERGDIIFGVLEDDGTRSICIHTREGVMTGRHDDKLIRGVHGELYPCKPDIFAETYDPA